MARPKYQENESRALVKIEDSFWKCLKENPFNKISIKMISLDAGLNHNTIYYYFKNLNDIANYCFHNIAKFVLRKEIYYQIIDNNFKIEASEIDEQTTEGWRKISLFASSGSTYLQDIFHNYLKQYWLKAMGLKWERLDETEKMQIEYTTCGLIGVIIESKNSKTMNVISFLRKTGKSQDIFTLTKKLVDKYTSQ